MSQWVNDYEPEAFFRYFEEITAIPRGSGNEKGIADYLEVFAKNHGLVCYRDEVHNILIQKPGQNGGENKKPVMLQGHTDMVCEKNAGVDHDFETDPIPLYRDGEYLRAKGTTLGADDGVAVAMMLTLLSDPSINHPPLECLFTVQEETGLIGASHFDFSKTKANRLINLDAEPEGTMLISCAGGMRCRLRKDGVRENGAQPAAVIQIRGLMGGHSGSCINENRKNANILMGRILSELRRLVSFQIASLNGGSKDNAIPRECDAVICLSDFEQAKAVTDRLAKEITSEVSKLDQSFSLTIQKTADCIPFDRETTDDLIDCLTLAPNGVVAMSAHIEGLVETSLNFGVIQTEGDTVKLTFSPRSSSEGSQNATEEKLKTLAKRCGFSFSSDSRYPGWAYNPHSKLREIAKECYQKRFGKEMNVEAIHAGLECGLFMEKRPTLDIIATGGTALEIHTPDECLEIASCERLYFWLKDVLAALPEE